MFANLEILEKAKPKLKTLGSEKIAFANFANKPKKNEQGKSEEQEKKSLTKKKEDSGLRQPKECKDDDGCNGGLYSICNTSTTDMAKRDFVVCHRLKKFNLLVYVC